ncbi:MAG: acylphosphatase [Erysipelothrix sp.]|nr:acylphosphatase [Erysipelothrix sp.]
MKKLRIYVSGRVQGVGFRYTTYNLAHEIGNLGGLVRNLSDGRVYIEVTGHDIHVTKFLNALETSHSVVAQVDNIEVIEDPDIIVTDKFRIEGY